ncbi:hypothetical protein ACUN7V_15040 [Quadrisphaera oryzae]|uniref:hypothetical protein n=1 Tax=Quadrisphaera TaxID=317661 RepID=UPI00164450E6|nr:hypothetical protein [Quadrisphaera sp. RL12-1S]MBC3762891.1 hypothetical protein [Quadrisphaera sp. RL12-1S]
MALGQAGDAAGDAAGDTDLLDLDADLDADLKGDGRGGEGGGGRAARGSRGAGLSRWPEAVPAWARGPAAVVVLVLAAGLGGAAVGSSHRDALDARSALQEALTVGYAFVTQRDGRGSTLAAQVHVALFNHGDAALDVRLQGLSTAHQGTASPPDEVQVDPGALVVAPVAVRVDCQAVRDDARAQAAAAQPDSPFDMGPYPTPAPTAPTVVLASVRRAVGGPAVDVRLPVVDAIASSLDQSLGDACGSADPAQLQTGWLWKEDGALRVTVKALTGAAPVRLQLDSTPGLDPTSDPPLPRDLRPGETAVVDISVHPQCSVVGDGALSRLDLQAVSGDGATESLGGAFDATTPAAGTPQWLARRVALACG